MASTLLYGFGKLEKEKLLISFGVAEKTQGPACSGASWEAVKFRLCILPPNNLVSRVRNAGCSDCHASELLSLPHSRSETIKRPHPALSSPSALLSLIRIGKQPVHEGLTIPAPVLGIRNPATTPPPQTENLVFHP